MAADAGGGTNQQRDWVMQRTMLRGALYSALLIGLTAALGACGGGGSGSTLTPTPMSGTMPLTIAADPESGFPLAPGTSIPAGDIHIQGKQGASGNLTVPVNVTFDSPLTVSTSQNNALDLEFDLAHPAFIVGHTLPAAGATLWAVNFNGPVRHHPLRDLTRLVLRHTYGTVTQVASDGKSLTITKDFPVLPVTNPE